MFLSITLVGHLRAEKSLRPNLAGYSLHVSYGGSGCAT